jgi:hypothetical protein
VPRPSRPRVPLPVAALGGAGLLPAAALAAALPLLGSGLLHDLAWAALLFYGALILSFLGGTWWAFASRDDPAWRWLAMAVTPSLVGWGLLVGTVSTATRAPATALLAAAVLASPLADKALAAAMLVPAWWMRLRVPLSLGLAACLGVAVWQAPVG